MIPASGRSRTLVPGRAEGKVLVLDEPLSFWGGLDAETGAVVDARHPQRGAIVSRRVLLMPSGRGSSSSSSVLAEALRAGTGPAAILLAEPDTIVVLGAIVAAELYGAPCPVVLLDPRAYAAVPAGASVVVEATGDLPRITTAPVRGRRAGGP